MSTGGVSFRASQGRARVEARALAADLPDRNESPKTTREAGSSPGGFSPTLSSHPPGGEPQGSGGVGPLHRLLV